MILILREVQAVVLTVFKLPLSLQYESLICEKFFFEQYSSLSWKQINHKQIVLTSLLWNMNPHENSREKSSNFVQTDNYSDHFNLRKPLDMD